MRRPYLALILLFYCCSSPSSGGPLEQPIQYNHSLHVQKQGIDCLECHRYAATHARATIPNTEVCADCHSDEPITDSPEEVKLLGYVDRKEKIPWRKVYRLDDHIYFSHRRHTVLAGIACEVCHGNVETMTKSLVKQTVPISMDRCIACHEKSGVNTDCVSCHR